MHAFLMISPFEADAGHVIGRDPRDISAAEWSENLPDPAVGMRAMRAKCLDCCGDNAAEVRKCVQHDCALWPFRMGCQPKNLRAVRMSEAAQ